MVIDSQSDDRRRRRCRGADYWCALDVRPVDAPGGRRLACDQELLRAAFASAAVLGVTLPALALAVSFYLDLPAGPASVALLTIGVPVAAMMNSVAGGELPSRSQIPPRKLKAAHVCARSAFEAADDFHHLGDSFDPVFARQASHVEDARDNAMQLACEKTVPLFVCHANCCRSVLACYLYRHLCNSAPARSAGLEPGERISDRAEHCCAHGGSTPAATCQ